MKRFTLADGTVLFQPPVTVSAIYRSHMPKLPVGPYRFDIIMHKTGLRVWYASRFKREVERERARLLSFDWT